MSLFKDISLRKNLWGFWHTQDREDGGPFITIDHKWNIPTSDGVIRHLLKEIDLLKSRVSDLEAKKK